MKTIDDIKTKIEKLRKELETEGGKLFIDHFKKNIFNKFPNLESFAFRGFASYWCDGRTL